MALRTVHAKTWPHERTVRLLELEGGRREESTAVRGKGYVRKGDALTAACWLELSLLGSPENSAP